MKLSIVITTRNRKEQLISCVESIKKANFNNQQEELIIIDDNSLDGTEKLDFNFFGAERGKIIHTKENIMMARARNLGAKNSSGRRIIFIDDDNVIDPAMIKELIVAADKDPKIGIVGPAMYYQDTEKKYLNYQRINFFTGKTTSYLDDKKGALFESDGIPNAFLIKKEVFERCGYFNEELIQTLTEPDFAFNARKFDFKCVAINEAKIFHRISASEKFQPEDLSGDYPQKAYCLMRNRSYIISQYGKIYHKFIYLLFFSWFWPLAYSLAVARHKRLDLIKFYWQGWWDGIIYALTGKIKNYFN